jgi:hypothetical protein
MSGAKHRRKGDRIEREFVDRHKAVGVPAERYPLSDTSRFRGAGHDVDIYAFKDEPPLVAEVKARKSGAGFATLENWLGEYDALFLRPQQCRSARRHAVAHVGALAHEGAAMSRHPPSRSPRRSNHDV